MLEVEHYYAEILPDAHLSIPDDLREKLKSDSNFRVMLLLDDDETLWENLRFPSLWRGILKKIQSMTP